MMDKFGFNLNPLALLFLSLFFQHLATCVFGCVIKNTLRLYTPVSKDLTCLEFSIFSTEQ